jgi:hypothetical protein
MFCRIGKCISNVVTNLEGHQSVLDILRVRERQICMILRYNLIVATFGFNLLKVDRFCEYNYDGARTLTSPSLLLLLQLQIYLFHQLTSHQHSRQGNGDLPSFFPPTKSIPSSIALSMNGLTAPVCSLTDLAFAQSASDTDCGSNVGSDEEEGVEGRDEGGVGCCVGEAKVAKTSRISSSYYHQLFTQKTVLDSLRDYR